MRSGSPYQLRLIYRKCSMPNRAAMPDCTLCCTIEVDSSIRGSIGRHFIDQPAMGASSAVGRRCRQPCRRRSRKMTPLVAASPMIAISVVAADIAQSAIRHRNLRAYGRAIQLSKIASRRLNRCRWPVLLMRRPHRPPAL